MISALFFSPVLFNDFQWGSMCFHVVSTCSLMALSGFWMLLDAFGTFMLKRPPLLAVPVAVEESLPREDQRMFPPRRHEPILHELLAKPR